MPDPLLQLNGVSKGFGGIPALHPIVLELGAGESLGLVGENGAGKSTLIRLLSGIHRPDTGSIRWQGRDVTFDSPLAAMGVGIATIHQELHFFGHLSVAENLFMGERWPRRRWGAVDWSALLSQAREQLDHFGLRIDPGAPFADLSAAEKQEVAIARALAKQARLLILDEPTASLTEPECDRLFEHLRRLRERGVSLIYVSHRLEEIRRLTDRVVVLRDGLKVAEYPSAEATVDRMVSDMVGRVWNAAAAGKRGPGAGVARLAAERISRKGLFADISFELFEGEILGLGGLVGAGRSEVARAVFGMYGLDSGRLLLRGAEWVPESPRHAVDSGVVYVPEERKRHGLVLDHSIAANITAGFLDRLSRWGMLRRAQLKDRVAHAMEACSVRCQGPDQAVGSLSGGNQQKALLARWLEREPDILILDEPTRGVDVGAKEQIHGWIRRLKEKGKSVLLISSDLPELLSLSDRVVVLHEGNMAGTLAGDDLNEQTFLHRASGHAGVRAPGGAAG